MAKPTINNITTFDATLPKKVNFLYSGTLGFYNALRIFNATTMTQVGSEIVTTGTNSYSVTIPTNTLTNGVNYYAQIQCRYSDGTASSEWSTESYFSCLATPSFTFDGISEGTTVTSSTLEATVNFKSEPDESGVYQTLSEYYFYLYDTEENLIYKTSAGYDGQPKYTYRALTNEVSYKIRATGTTNKNIEVDTGLVTILVKFEEPSAYSRMYTTIDSKTGVVNYTTNFSVVEPDEDPDDYTISDSTVDLTEKSLNYTLEYSGDFTIGIKIKQPKNIVLKLANSLTESSAQFITLQRMDTDDTHFRWKVIIPNEYDDVILYSEDEFEYTANSWYVVFIRRINNIYGLYASDFFINFEDSNFWFSKDDVYPGGLTLIGDDVYVTFDTTTTRIDKDNLQMSYGDAEPTDVDKFAIWLGGADI